MGLTTINDDFMVIFQGISRDLWWFHGIFHGILWDLPSGSLNRHVHIHFEWDKLIIILQFPSKKLLGKPLKTQPCYSGHQWRNPRMVGKHQWKPCYS